MNGKVQKIKDLCTLKENPGMSLLKAKEVEMGKFGCEIIAEDRKCIIGVEERIYEDGGDGMEQYCFSGDIPKDIYIIGLPVTLSRVLYLLGDDFSYQSGEILRYYKERNTAETYCDWILFDSGEYIKFEKQSSETIDAIYNHVEL